MESSLRVGSAGKVFTRCPASEQILIFNSSADCSLDTPNNWIKFRTLGAELQSDIGIELKLLVRQIEGCDVYLSALGEVA